MNMIEDMKAEPLCNELRQCLIKADGLTYIHHPMLITIYNGDDPSVTSTHLNQALNAIQRTYAKYIAEKKFSEAIMLCVTRPYRTDALDLYERQLDDKTYWTLLALVWIDQENPEDFASEWRRRFKSNRRGRFYLMLPDEREQFFKLPQELTVYRAALADDIRGLSWTTELRVARFFAHRFGRNVPIYQAKVDRDDVIAYWTRRNESEILVLNSETLRDITLVKGGEDGE